MGQAADLAHTGTEKKENQQQRYRQPDKQPDPYNDSGMRAEPEQNEHTATITAFPNGASLARNHSSDTRGCCVAGDQTEC